MPPLLSRIVRSTINTDRIETPVDAVAGGLVQFWAGSPARLRLAFRLAGTLVDDFTAIAGIEVQLKALGPAGGAPPETNAPLASVIVASLNAGLTEAEWAAGTAWHAEVILSAANLARAADAYWLVVVALPVSAAPFTLAAGKCQITGDGYGSGEAAPDPESPPYTQAESDLKYLGKTGAFTDGNLVKTVGGIAQDSGVSVAGVTNELDEHADTLSDHGSRLTSLEANDSVTNARLANMATARIKGRSTAGTGDPEDLTGAQVNAMLPAATDTLKGLVKMLTGPGVAPADTAVRGDDLALGNYGGVSFAGGSYPVSADSPLARLNASGTFGFAFDFFSGSATGETFQGFVGFGNTTNGQTLLFYLSGSDLRMAMTRFESGVASAQGDAIIPQNTNGTLSLQSTAGVWTASFAGVSITTTLPAVASVFSAIGQTPTNPSTLLGGGRIVRSGYFANRVLTSDEIKGVPFGKIPADLARLGSEQPVTYAAASSSLDYGKWGFAFDGSTPASASYGGSSVTCSNFATPGVIFGVFVPLVPPGQSVRITGTIDQPCAVKLRVPPPFFDAGLVFISAGDFSVTISNSALVSAYAVTFNGGGAATTVSNIKVEIVGTVEHLRPDKVSLRSVWRGVTGWPYIASGNATPMLPEPTKVRPEKIRYNLATSTASDPLPAGWTITPISTGKIKITPPAWAYAIDRPLITANTDGDSFVAVDYDTDATDIYLTCKTVGAAPAVTAAKLRIAIEWRE